MKNDPSKSVYALMEKCDLTFQEHCPQSFCLPTHTRKNKYSLDRRQKVSPNAILSTLQSHSEIFKQNKKCKHHTTSDA